MLSEKQRGYWALARRRWNFKVGAVRSGKTFIDCAVVIPRRLLALGDGGGLVLLLGHSREALERNVLGPMREIWGSVLVGDINRQSGRVRLFGREAYTMGAKAASGAARLQGMSVRYCYGDEVSVWHPEVFRILQSRLDRPDSCFDGTCNPQHPQHWLKGFLDSDADLFCQHYTIDDNPHLPPAFVQALKREYAGTVYYQRYIRGEWVRAEGAIYRPFAAGTAAAFLCEAPPYDYINIGVDFGGSKSAFAFVACGLCDDFSHLSVLRSERHPAEGVDPERLYTLFMAFYRRVVRRWGEVNAVYADSAEQTLLNGMRGLGLPCPVKNSVKQPIMDRVRCVVALMGRGRFSVTSECASLSRALCEAVYDDGATKDVRLDDGTSDIDSLDAFEYAFERQLAGYSR